MILALYKKGPMKKTELYAEIPSSNLNSQKLNDLANVGLVTLNSNRFDNNSTVVELTKLGSTVAINLITVENLMIGKVSDSVAQESIPADHPSAAVAPEVSPSPQPPRQLLDPHLSLMLRVVYERQHSTFPELVKYTKLADTELRSNLDVLVSSGWIRTAGDRYVVTEEGAKKARLVIALENGQDVVETDYEEPAAGGTATKGSG